MADLSDVFAMLDACARDHGRRLTDHYWIVTWNGLTYPTLPTGAKSDKRKHVQVRKVAKMVQVLKIDRDCAVEHLPLLANVLKKHARPSK